MYSGWLIPFFRLPRAKKRFLQVFADCFLLVLSYILAFFLRLDHWDFLYEPGVWKALGMTLLLSLVLFVRIGFYRAVIRYISGKAFRVIMLGVGMSVVFLLCISQIFDLPVPRSVPFIYGLLSVFTIGGVRFFLRYIYFQSLNRNKTRVLIYGAGAAGRQLLSSFSHGADYSLVAFVDDSRELHGQNIQGFKVYPRDEIERLIQYYGVKIILLAMPSVSRSVKSEILKHLEPLPVHVRTVPALSDVVSGKAKVSEIREVALEDLLGRDPVPPQHELLEINITGKVVLVSGAGGSIGSELCRQILLLNPEKLILFEISEFGLYRCEQDLLNIALKQGLSIQVIPVLGSIQDENRMKSVFRQFGVQTIFHAAAYKHVPLVEQNIVEGIRNNVFGTLSMVQAAVDCGVSSFTLISTDKAVRPTNIMGASKRMAELICQAFAALNKRTIFSMVRFGNVLGSSGSVIPLFHRQIAKGGPITVTHPDITRYFMTIPEASQLVIQASAMASGGEVFVLNMGDSVKILDLAVRMAKLHGLNPQVQRFNDSNIIGDASAEHVKTNHFRSGDIAIIFTGLRPGEKLYEELLISGNPRESSHPLIMVANENKLDWEVLKDLLLRLEDACDDYSVPRIIETLTEAQTSYVPVNDVVVDCFSV